MSKKGSPVNLVLGLFRTEPELHYSIARFQFVMVFPSQT